MNNELSDLKVYYGWSVLNKIRRKPALSVIFENEKTYTDRVQNSIRRLQKTCFVRTQTKDEAKDGRKSNRTMTEFTFYLEQKPFTGDLNKVLETNRQADINNVPTQTLNEIQEALRKGFKKAYFQNVKQ